MDIDKIQKYKLNFVVKFQEDVPILREKIRNKALKKYFVEKVVDDYMACIDEIINIPMLQDRFNDAVKQGYLNKILDEIVTQSKVEFNYEETEEED